MKKFFSGRILSLLAVGGTLLLASCQNDNSMPNPNPVVKPSIPDSLSQCDTANLSVIKALQKQNPNTKIFEGDKPSEWKKINLKWEKNAEGKFVITGIMVKDTTTFSEPLNITLDKTTALANLKEIDIDNQHIATFSVTDQPSLSTVNLNGENKTTLKQILLKNNSILKDISISNIPNIKGGSDFQIRNGHFNKITLNNLPKLDDLIRISTYYGDTITTTVKELVLQGDMSNLNQIDLQGKALEKFTNECKELPNLETLNLNSNSLMGDLTIENMPKLKMLNLQNNKLSSLTVNKCAILKELNVFNNPDLKSLPLSDLSSLKIISFYNDNISGNLDLSGVTTLTSIDGHGNQVSTINLGKNVLDVLNMTKNALTAFSIPAENSENIYTLNLADNQLMTLDISKMSDLESLNVNNNKLTDITTATIAEGEDKGYADIDCKNNALPLSVLEKITASNESNHFEYAPQTIETGVMTNGMIDAKMYADKGYTLTPQVKDGGSWKVAPEGSYTMSNGKYTFTKTGTYRVAITNIPDYNLFTDSEPYAIGNVMVK